MNSPNVAAYGQGMMYTDLAKYGEAIRTAGWDSIILAMLHPHAEGNIYFGQTEIIQYDKNKNKAVYIGDPKWPGQLQELLTGPGTSLYHLLAGIGGAGVGDFVNIQQIYQDHNNSLPGPFSRKTFRSFMTRFP